jgi:hypothetical protein
MAEPETTPKGFTSWGPSDKGVTVALSNGSSADEDDPLYVLCDDEGKKFVYVGEDTFTRLPEGPERDHWLRKMREGKVTAMEIVGAITFPIESAGLLETKLLTLPSHE